MHQQVQSNIYQTSFEFFRVETQSVKKENPSNAPRCDIRKRNRANRRNTNAWVQPRQRNRTKKTYDKRLETYFTQKFHKGSKFIFTKSLINTKMANCTILLKTFTILTFFLEFQNYIKKILANYKRIT